MDSHNDFILNAFNELKTRVVDHFPFNHSPLNEEESDFFEKFDRLLSNIQQNDVDYSFQAQDLLAQFIRCYANLVPLIKRELLWFIGGECLHYLGDDEVSFFQDLEEQLYQLGKQNIEVDIGKQIQILRSETKTLRTQH